MKRKKESMATEQGKKNLEFWSKGFEEDKEDGFLSWVSLFIDEREATPPLIQTTDSLNVGPHPEIFS